MVTLEMKHAVVCFIIISSSIREGTAECSCCNSVAYEVVSCAVGRWPLGKNFMRC